MAAQGMMTEQTATKISERIWSVVLKLELRLRYRQLDRARHEARNGRSYQRRVEASIRAKWLRDDIEAIEWMLKELAR